MVLRAADRSHWRLEIHTNLFSAKVEELQHTPIAALHVWGSASSVQIRLQADVTIITGAETADAWAAVSDRSRAAYSSDHRPGHPIPSALAYEQTSNPQAFAVLHLDLRVMDPLHLGTQHHRRAQFTRDDNWAGRWLVP